MSRETTSRTDLCIYRYIHEFSEVIVYYNTEGYIKLYVCDTQIDLEELDKNSLIITVQDHINTTFSSKFLNCRLCFL